MCSVNYYTEWCSVNYYTKCVLSITILNMFGHTKNVFCQSITILNVLSITIINEFCQLL